MDLLPYLILITVAFILYSEASVGNILFRTDSSGHIALNVGSLIHFMVHPLTNKTLWSLHTLDINYPFVILSALVIYYIM